MLSLMQRSSPLTVFEMTTAMLDSDARQDSYRTDPVGWARDVLGIHLWSKQVEICESVKRNKRTVVASCHSSGKSLVSSVLSCWWIAVHPPGSAIVVSTAPTYRQVNAILWEEMRKHHRSAKALGLPLPGTITGADVWKLGNGEIVGMGRKPKDGDSHAFQGIHRRYVLVIIDEAAGVPEELWTGVEAITTTANSRILAIGNPDDRETTFGDVFEEDRYADLWHRIRIPADSTPNFTGEQVPDPLPDVLLQPGWVADRRAAWGEEDARFRSKVMAQFPDTSQFGLFGASLLAKAFVDTDEQVRADGALILGVDVARYGDDRSVVAARRGKLCWIEDDWRDLDTVATAQRVLEIAERLVERDERGMVTEKVEIRVDATGVGAGVVDTLQAERVKYGRKHTRPAWWTVVEMIGAAKAAAEGGSVKGYGNARAYWHDQLKHQMRNGRVRIKPHEQLYSELGVCRFRYSSGKMYVVSKDDLRREGKKSPDFADALVYVSAPVPRTIPVGTVLSSDPNEARRNRVAELMRRAHLEKAMMISPY